MGQSGTSNNKDTLYNHSDELFLFRNYYMQKGP